MQFFNCYQSRLIAIMVMVFVFIITIISTTHYIARDIVYNSSIQQQKQVAKLYQREINNVKKDLHDYTKLIAEDSLIQKYVYAIVRIGSDPTSLVKLFDKRFSSSKHINTVIFSNQSKVLLNTRKKNALDILKTFKKDKEKNIYYQYENDHIKLISYLPIYYQGEKVGSVMEYFRLDKEWLNSLPLNTGSQLFITQGQTIISSSYSSSMKKFAPKNQYIQLDDERYKLTPIPFITDSTDNTQTPQLWLADSVTLLFSPLQEYNQVSIIIIASGGLILFIFGVVATKKISRTIKELIDSAEQMTQGLKPEIKRSESNTEIATLYNQFADMVDAIHDRENEIKKANRLLKKISITDELTRLYNRRHLNEVFPKLQSQALRGDMKLYAILCDIDFFKKINDTYGHTAGDQCLVYFSNLLRSITRDSDYLFRMGGEEFLILTLMPSIDQAAALANKICQATQTQAIEWQEDIIPMTVSAGISVCKQLESIKDSEEPLSLLVSQADHALYDAKHRGRNQVCIDESSAQKNSTIRH